VEPAGGSVGGVTTKRKAISTRTRFEIFKRDGFTCQYCGAHPPAVILHVDHIVPVKEGGGNEDTNLVTACETCNFGKAAKSLSSVPVSLAARAAEVAEREAQLRGYSEVMAAQRERIEADCWLVADIYMERFLLDGIRRTYFQSIRNFVEKIGVHECIRAMEIATGKGLYEARCFRYFCGVCWGIVRGQE
jgi:hypothetical protein